METKQNKTAFDLIYFIDDCMNNLSDVTDHHVKAVDRFLNSESVKPEDTIAQYLRTQPSVFGTDEFNITIHVSAQFKSNKEKTEIDCFYLVACMVKPLVDDCFNDYDNLSVSIFNFNKVFLNYNYSDIFSFKDTEIKDLFFILGKNNQVTPEDKESYFSLYAFTKKEKIH